MRVPGLLLCILCVSSVSMVHAAPTSYSHPAYTAAELQADAAVLYDAFKTLHPGIYRYSTPQEFDQRYAELRTKLAGGAGLDQAFLDFTRFAEAIRCGHTWTNPLNQPDPVAAALLERPDRLPLHFTVIGRRFLVTQALAGSGAQDGEEILAVDGIPVEQVIQRLWPYLRADGASDGKRLAQIGHDAEQSAFDLYYPLLAPARDGRRSLSLRKPGAAAHDVSVQLVAEATRDAALAKQPDAAGQAWSYRVDGDLAIIDMPTWAFWNVKFDWSAWMQRTFTDLDRRGIPYLVIDLRRDEGGDGAIGDALLRRLATTPKTYASHMPRLVYDVVPDRLRPYLSTWDRSFYDQRPREEALASGGYTLKDREPDPMTIVPDPAPYRGRAFVLIGPTDSSATFEFARIVKDTGVATLVGQPTGGNRRGINGGNMFFLRLPNTGISVDVPVIAWMPRDAQPDAPVMPDVTVAPDLEAVAAGRDPELERVRQLIQAQEGASPGH